MVFLFALLLPACSGGAKMAEADRLWEEGKKAEAVAVYKAMAEKNLPTLGSKGREKVFQRLIEYDLEQGDIASAKAHLAKAGKEKVKLPPDLTQKVQDGEAQLAAKKEAEEREKAAQVEREKKEVAEKAEQVKKQRAEKLKATTLTADFLPYKEGTAYYEYGSVKLTTPAVALLHKVDCPGDGKIHRTLVKIGKAEVGSPTWVRTISEKEKYPKYHRVKDGFVEIGDHIGETETVYWEPVVKIGAKLGDTWEWEVPRVSKHRYEVREFTYTPSETIRCVIRKDSTSHIDGKELVTRTTRVVA